MFQRGTDPQALRAVPLGLRAGATWLLHLGLFGWLFLLSGLVPRKPPAVALPKETAPVALPASHATRSEQSSPASVRRIPQVAPPPAPPPDMSCATPDSAALPFTMSTMTPPELISGDTSQLQRRAREVGVHGLVVAKCTITCIGEARDCRIIKSLPSMDEAVIAALESRRYRPARFGGMPVTISYAFNIKIAQP